MKEKSIDSTFEKKTQEKGWGRVIYQSQTESGSQAWKMLRRNAPSSLACFGQVIIQKRLSMNRYSFSAFTCNIKDFMKWDLELYVNKKTICC